MAPSVIFREHRQDRLSLLAALRVHAGSRVAAHSRLSDAARERSSFIATIPTSRKVRMASTTSTTSTATKAYRARAIRMKICPRCVGAAASIRASEVLNSIPICGRCGASSWTISRRSQQATSRMRSRCHATETRVGSRAVSSRSGAWRNARWKHDADVVLPFVPHRDARRGTPAPGEYNYDAYFPNGITAQTPAGLLSKLASAGTLLGRVDAARFLIHQMRAPGVLANRMGLREGPQAMDVERLGRASEALHHALLQSEPVEPGKDAILRMFPAWPTEWDPAFDPSGAGGFRDIVHAQG